MWNNPLIKEGFFILVFFFWAGTDRTFQMLVKGFGLLMQSLVFIPHKNHVVILVFK